MHCTAFAEINIHIFDAEKIDLGLCCALLEICMLFAGRRPPRREGGASSRRKGDAHPGEKATPASARRRPLAKKAPWRSELGCATGSSSLPTPGLYW